MVMHPEIYINELIEITLTIIITSITIIITSTTTRKLVLLCGQVNKQINMIDFELASKG